MHEKNKTPQWKDLPLLAAEWSARQVYWRAPRLRAWVKRRRAVRRQAPRVARRDELKAYLRNIGVTEGALVMAHTSIDGLCLAENATPSQWKPNLMETAGKLLADLFELIGEKGTLVMPTHVAYPKTERCLENGELLPTLLFDPTDTPCNVGLVNEWFWRSPGVQRSLHPYNTLAARGPLASELLHDNLNDHKPLPHGLHSAYYRFCRKNGLVVSIGVPLGGCMTLIHVAEEIRDQQWPIKNFFEEKTYLVEVEGQQKSHVVRQTRSTYMMFSLCGKKMSRDLRGEGILHEDVVGNVPVGWARAGEVLEYLMARNHNSSYPYYLPRLVRQQA